MWSRRLHRFSARSGCNGATVSGVCGLGLHWFSARSGCYDAAVFDGCGLGGCIGFLLDLSVMVSRHPCLMCVV